MTDDLPFDYPSAANPGAPAPRKCKRHRWTWWSRFSDGSTAPGASLNPANDRFFACDRCGKVRDDISGRRNRNNRKRGTSDELRVAEILGGRKVGPLGLPWDVEVAGYLRAQAKKLDRWPSLNEVVKWLDAIPQGAELRAVTLADTPGQGKRTRRLIVLDLEEYARWHGQTEKGEAA